MAAPVVVVAADQVLQKMPCVYDSSQVMNETENKYMGKEFPGLLLHHLSSQACEKNMASKGMSVLVEKRLATANFMCRGSREAIGWSYRDLRGMGSVRCQLGGLMLFVLGKVSQAKGI